MTARAASWLAIVLLAFSTFSVLSLFPPPDSDYDLLELAQTAARNDAKGSKPTESAVTEYYEAFMAERRSVWLESVLFFCASVLAALVTLWRRNVGAWLVLLVCAYLLYVSGPPFVRMAIDSGLINFISLVFSTTTGQHGLPTGLVISWHIVVAPFAYTLLALGTIYLVWQAHRSRGRESNE